MSIQTSICPKCGKEGFHMHEITFATEAERLKARSLTSLIATRLYGTSSVRQAEYDSMMRAFDDCFPPIAPPKMVPEEWLTLINTEGHRVGDLYDRTAPLTASSGYRIARVRVVEVDDE